MEAMFDSRRSLRSHPTLTLPCKQGREPVIVIQLPTSFECKL